MISSILTQFVFVAMLVIQIDGQAQSIAEPAIGESYFANVLLISFQLKIAPRKQELVPAFVSLTPQSPFGLNTTSDPLLLINNSLVLWRSQNALKKFLLSSNDIQQPWSFGSIRSKFLLARWEGRDPFHTPTKTFPENKLDCIGRSAYDHVELVWSAEGFKLDYYQNKDKRARKCPPLPPAVLTESISLMVHSHQSNLTLRPNGNAGNLPLFVVLTVEGDAQIAINPIEGSVCPVTNQDNNAMHTKPSKSSVWP